MSELKLISPMLDNLAIGGPISDHHGIRCYPAMDETTNQKYILKVVSIPASRTQLDALLLSGAYPDEASALVYFKELADGVIDEAEVLRRLSQLEGFLNYEQCQLVPMDDDIGFHIYLLGTYKQTLSRSLQKAPMTHLGAVNLGLDLCAALTVCRRCGYLYADLKPENIYITEDNGYRIGDLGFLRLDSLKYASLPDKYRSAYTAPEISDAFSELNSTLDTYAVGMILYQLYNNAELPVIDPEKASEPLPAPANADYEMSEIILKACAADPAERWEDPAQMGQALVSYMQRNGANDTPIVPPTIPVAEPVSAEEEEVEEAATEEALSPATEEEPTEASAADDAKTEQDEELASIAVLLESVNDETDPVYDESEIGYDEVSEEITEMLTQADEIVSHPVPEPVVAPEPIDVPIPEPITAEEAADEATADDQATIAITLGSDEESEEDAEDAKSDQSSQEESSAEAAGEEPPEKTGDTAEEDESDEEDEEEPAPPKKKRRWLRITIIAIILLGILAAGFYFYTNYYLIPIESMTLDGREDTLTVHIETDIDESLLTVICKDQRGGQLEAPVENGVATFTDLIPDTGYTVTITVDGFHKLTGDISKAYSTPVETNIAQFNAVTGYEDGSVILVFTVDGKDAASWNVVYSADGEAEKSVPAQNYTATITGLTIGKEYTFRLQPDSELFITGTSQITFIASPLIYAQDLTITSCLDGKMTVSWLTPKDTTVESWSIHCTNGSDYNETITTSDNTAEFTNVSNDQSYTVTATAAGMSVNKQVSKAANAVSLTDVKLTEYPTYAELSWDCSEDLDTDWVISYSVDGLTVGSIEETDEGYFHIPFIVPDATYRISIKGADGTEPLGSPYVFVATEAEIFSCSYSDLTVSAADMTFSMVTPPSWDYWDRFDLDSSDYTTSYSAGQKAGIIINLAKDYGYSWDEVVRVFAIYDADGNLVTTSFTTNNWNNMWSSHYCELDIPYMPKQPGEYTLQLYFNGQFVTEQNFTITQ